MEPGRNSLFGYSAVEIIGRPSSLIAPDDRVIEQIEMRARLSFGSHQIWDGLNLDVYRGEILAIVGGSGQGKSVLMRLSPA